MCGVPWPRLVMSAIPVFAQLPPSGTRATGENYHVEFSGNLWNPTPNILINSESISGIIGSDIDFVEDLGIESNWFTQLKVVLRPATKHKFRFEVHAHPGTTPKGC